MGNQFRLLIFSIFMMFLLGGFAQVSACSCRKTSLCSSYNHAKYVFVGKVVKYEKTKDNYVLGEVELEVLEGFVGTKKGEILKSISSIDAACSFPFEKDATYLIYGFQLSAGRLANKLGKNAFWTTICSRNRQVLNDSFYLSEDISFLRNLPEEKSGGTISGTVYTLQFIENDLKQVPFRGIKIEISEIEKKKTYYVFTDKNGRFEMNVPIGIYRVIPKLPKNLKLSGDLDEPFSIRKGGCRDIDYEVEEVQKK